MRKFLVKLFNLIYLAGAVVATVFLCIKPMIQTSVTLSLTSDQVADNLVLLLNKNSGGSEGGGSESRITYRDGSSETTPIDRDSIKEAFPNGFSLSVGLTVEAKDAFNLKEKNILSKSVTESLQASLNSVVSKVSESLHTLINKIAETKAKEELKNQINAQIAQYFEGASQVSDEDVNAVYDNIHEQLSSGEATPEALANAIIGQKDEETGEYPQGSLLYILEEKKKETGSEHIYVVADPTPSQEEIETDIAKEEADKKYFIKVTGDNPETPDVTETEYYTRPTTYELRTYYIEKYDASNVNAEEVADKLAEALEGIPGLVDTRHPLANPQPNEADFNATVVSSKHFVYKAQEFVKAGAFDNEENYQTIEKMAEQPSQTDVQADIEAHGVNKHFAVAKGDGYVYATTYDATAEYYYVTYITSITAEEYNQTVASNTYMVLQGETYVYAQVYDSAAQYYTEQKVINDIDTALTNIIEQYLGKNSSSEEGSGSRALVRGEGEGEGGDDSQTSKEKLAELLKEYLLKIIPLDKINDVTQKLDPYANYVCLGIIGLFAFPWVLFGLVTLIRTLRRRKIWTKPWIVFVFAFIQVFLGLVLTYGMKYFLPLFEGVIPEAARQYLAGLSIDIRTGCLAASFIYLAFIPLTIVYIIIAHRLKKEYKFESRAIAMQMARRRRY